MLCFRKSGQCCVLMCWQYGLYFTVSFNSATSSTMNIKDSVPPSEACLYGHISWFWHRLINNPYLGCPSLQLLGEVPGPSLRMYSGLMYRNDQCWSLEVPSLLRRLFYIISLTVIRVAGSQLGVHLPVPFTIRRKGAMGDSVTDVSM